MMILGKKIAFGTVVALTLILSGCVDSKEEKKVTIQNDSESAKVKEAKEIWAKNIIEEEEKKQRQKELRKNGQGNHLNNNGDKAMFEKAKLEQEKRRLEKFGNTGTKSNE